MSSKLSNITGHQSFYLRQSWLSKAVNAIINGVDIFSGVELINAIDTLGIGSNMVKSLRYWIKISNIVEYSNKSYMVTDEARQLFESDNTLQSKVSKWIIHIWLCKNLPSWEQFFVRDKLSSFTKEQLMNRLNIVLHEEGSNYSLKTIKEQIDIFLNMYRYKDINDPEENNISPLATLQIIEQINQDEYRFRIMHEQDVPSEVILYILCKEQSQQQISFDESFELVKRFIKIDYYSLRKIIEKLENKGFLNFDRAVGLNNIIIQNRNDFNVINCFKGGLYE
jgi:hypothetical protein